MSEIPKWNPSPSHLPQKPWRWIFFLLSVVIIVTQALQKPDSIPPNENTDVALTGAPKPSLQTLKPIGISSKTPVSEALSFSAGRSIPSIPSQVERSTLSQLSPNELWQLPSHFVNEYLWNEDIISQRIDELSIGNFTEVADRLASIDLNKPTLISEELSKDGQIKKVVRTYSKKVYPNVTLFSTEIYKKTSETWQILKLKEEVLEQVVIQLKHAPSLDLSSKILSDLNLKLERPLDQSGTFLTRISSQSPSHTHQIISDLFKSEEVNWAHSNHLVYHTRTPNDVQFNKQWGLHNAGGQLTPALVLNANRTGLTLGNVMSVPDNDINGAETWESVNDCTGLPVGVVDSGVDLLHEDLQSNLDKTKSTGFVVGSPGAQDLNGHGTHVAGIIGAVGNNKIGVAGICWKANITGIRVMGADGSGTLDAVVQGINYGASSGQKIINLSLGGSTPSDAMRDAITNYGNSGGLAIIAAGNSGQDIGTAMGAEFPAAYNLASQITVASMKSDGQISLFSNFSPSIVHIGAPGDGIFSTWPKNLDTRDGNPDGYFYSSGTSMAAPMVAGAVALLWANHPTKTADQIKALILSQTVVKSNMAPFMVEGKQLRLDIAINFNVPQVQLSSVQNGVIQFHKGRLKTKVKVIPSSSFGALSQVEVLINNVSAGVFRTSEFDLDVASFEGSIQFKLTDVNGLVAHTHKLQLGTNNLPEALLNFQEGARVETQGNLKMTAYQFDSDGSIKKGGVLLESKSLLDSSQQEGSFEVKDLKPGSHSLVMDIEDNLGGKITKNVNLTIVHNPSPGLDPNSLCHVTETVKLGSIDIKQVVSQKLVANSGQCSAFCATIILLGSSYGKSLECSYQSQPVAIGGK